MGRYFLDTEFIEDGKTIELISLGLVDERGCALYLCNSECDLNRANDWVKEHVLPQLPSRPAEVNGMDDFHVHYRAGLRVLQGWGPRHEIREALVAFIGSDRAPEFWGYYADYDWVVLCQLFGTMVDLPEHFPKFCLDLKQLIWQLNIPREDLPHQDDEHDALGDALWLRRVYRATTRH